MKARDLRDRSTEDLVELERSLANERFQNKFKNFTNRLDDTSVIRKAKRDLARVKLILVERARGITVVYKSADEAAAPKKPKTRPPKPPADAEETKQTKETKAPASKPAKAAAKTSAAAGGPQAAPSHTKKSKAAPAGKAAAKKPRPKPSAKGEK
jgi:large subunit ribosomal protein L29